jgi:hypothetical protein
VYVPKNQHATGCLDDGIWGPSAISAGGTGIDGFWPKMPIGKQHDNNAPAIALARSTGTKGSGLRKRLTGGTVRYSCQAFTVRALMIVCMLTASSQAQETVNQFENAAELPTDSSRPAIEVVAAEAPATQTQADPFVQLLDRAIETTSKRTLIANSHSPWQIFHCILALREKTVLRLGDQKVNAIEWLSTAEPQFDNQPWLMLTPHGAKFHPYTRMYAFEGHPSQFLALLSQSNLPMDYPFHVQGKVVTLKDLVNNTMQEVNTREEVTWVLWALQHFLKPDATWTNQEKEQWSIERLVKIETEAPVVGTPCGGNHRLFALTRARDKYLASGGQLRGVWYQADQKIRQHIEIARSLQNGDGSFSSESYKGPGHTTDVNKRFNTTGHTMEFLAISLPKERLNEPWVRNAVWMLSRELIIHRDTKIDCGPLFHSLDTLILYRERIRAGERPSEPLMTPEATAKAGSNQTAETPLKLETAPKPVTIAKPVEAPKKVAKVLDDTKPVSPESQATPAPAPEPIEIPELKTEVPQLEQQPKLDSPSAQGAQSKRLSTRPVKSVVTKSPSPTGNSNTAVPKIDPSKLPNVGQVAKATKTAEPIRMAKKERNPTSPPALLPDAIATPLPSSRPKPPIPITIPDVTDLSARLQPGALESPIDEHTDECGVESTIPLPPLETPVDLDEPVSALSPANPG